MTTTSTSLYIEFELGSERYAFSISSIQEIIRLQAMTDIPNAMPAIRGVINLRGSIIPIFSLRALFNQHPAADTKETRIIIVQAGHKTVGLSVDRVCQVVSFSEIKPGSESFGDRDRPLLSSIGRVDNRYVGILDVQELFSKRSESL
ncbi:chemotaxis protein CheW [Paenibacillus sp. HJGM_3]|uniref:chemotaxis protein CheW n=1 Tax=Paenibacillus sp. HJGM_3 TaxID=3379816 RepID=UPI00385906ED